MKKIRRYLEGKFQMIPVFILVAVLCGLVIASLIFSAYSALFICIASVIVIVAVIFVMVVAFKTDRWWYEEESKGVKQDGR